MAQTSERSIRFFNTLCGREEDFIPLKPGHVTLYTCGPTVYDFAHIGNFRTFLFEDLLRRFLQSSGYEVCHVMNITDVDDKTIAGAAREGKTLQEFTGFYARAFNEDLKTLNILLPAMQPRATDEIGGDQGMIQVIDCLIRKGMAYEKDGSVYFRVSSFAPYGKLSRKKLDQNVEGARVDVDEYEKEQGADFALWKKAKTGEPSWESPWGPGRPGWHIECSVMSMKHLGPTLDIHAGGEDLIFPHHENEIAQSESFSGKPFVRYWLHAKHLLVNGEKMSKSKGNFYTLRDLMAMGHDPMTVRLALLSAHYRSSLNFTLDGLRSAKASLERIRDFWISCKHKSQATQTGTGSGEVGALIRTFRGKIRKALGADLNSPLALGEFFELIHETNKLPEHSIGKKDYESLDAFFLELDNIFGIFTRILSGEDIPAEIRALISDRNHARKDKDFKRADELRDKIRDQGFTVEDTPQGPRVKKIL